MDPCHTRPVSGSKYSEGQTASSLGHFWDHLGSRGGGGVEEEESRREEQQERRGDSSSRGNRRRRIFIVWCEVIKGDKYNKK